MCTHIDAYTHDQWAIPVNRCTPPRRSNLISLRGIKMAFLINSLGVKTVI